MKRILRYVFDDCWDRDIELPTYSEVIKVSYVEDVYTMWVSSHTDAPLTEYRLSSVCDGEEYDPSTVGDYVDTFIVHGFSTHLFIVDLWNYSGA